MHCTPSVYRRVAGEGIITPQLKCLLMPSVIPWANAFLDISGKILRGFISALHYFAMRLFDLSLIFFSFISLGRRRNQGWWHPSLSFITIYHSNTRVRAIGRVRTNVYHEAGPRAAQKRNSLPRLRGWVLPAEG